MKEEPPAADPSQESTPPSPDDPTAQASSAGASPDGLPERYDRWLTEIRPLITGLEHQLFLRLTKNYQRDAFIQQFWKVRDPYPRTPRNELKERWPLRLAEARGNYGSLTDDRSRVLLVHGQPAGRIQVNCTKTRSPAEIWVYQGSDHVDLSLMVVFYQARYSDEHRVWNPANGNYAIQSVLGRSRGCINGRRLQDAVSLISQYSNYEADLARFLAKPRPRSQEWVHTFVASSTDLPSGAKRIEGTTLDLAFPGRHQNRTVVYGLLSVPIESVGVGEYAAYRSHDFLLTGEVIIGETLFENFRYKFGFPEQIAPGVIPLAFQRYLRPGQYRIIVKLEDLNGERAFREEVELVVPQVDEIFEVPTFKDPRTAQLFAEATEAIDAGETTIRLIPPHDELQTGLVRFDTLVAGGVEKVRYYLDDRFVLAKNRPPFNVEIDLGSYPDLHALRAEGFDAEGQEVASDELLINTGGYRFEIKLVEPRRSQRYSQSLRARAEIEVPEGRSLERVEFYLNETLVATLFQEPWVHPVVLPPAEEIAYMRAVAYLPDGNSTEDLVFINAPDIVEELEIQFVELYTTVLDSKGRPVEGLTESQFTVFEDGVRQKVARFDLVENLPIHVGILIDNSASMVGTLNEVRKAALNFFQQAITPRDRAAVITFNSFPNLAVELTNDRAALGSGLAGLVPEGKTALYDSVMFSLYYFTGIKGQRAVLILSDGKDESSRFEFDETLDYARRAGITIYSIGFRLFDSSARGKLARLADETGGRAFFIRDISELDAAYGQVQRELRSQYLIAYQSSNTEDSEAFRAVDLKVDRRELEVKTLSGYYP